MENLQYINTQNMGLLGLFALGALSFYYYKTKSSGGPTPPPPSAAPPVEIEKDFTPLEQIDYEKLMKIYNKLVEERGLPFQEAAKKSMLRLDNVLEKSDLPIQEVAKKSIHDLPSDMIQDKMYGFHEIEKPLKTLSSYVFDFFTYMSSFF